MRQRRPDCQRISFQFLKIHRVPVELCAVHLGEDDRPRGAVNVIQRKRDIERDAVLDRRGLRYFFSAALSPSGSAFPKYSCTPCITAAMPSSSSCWISASTCALLAGI